jgi:hypothetical protein
MDNLGRLLLRFILVPLGYFVAVVAGTVVIVVGSWKLGPIAVTSDPDAQAIAVFGFVFVTPVLLVMLLTVMWLPGSIGVLIAEGFAIRSFLFHAGNGAVTAWVTWSMFGYVDDRHIPVTRAGLLGDRGLERGLLEARVPHVCADAAAGYRPTSAAIALGNLLYEAPRAESATAENSYVNHPDNRLAQMRGTHRLPGRARYAARRLRQMWGLVVVADARRDAKLQGPGAEAAAIAGDGRRATLAWGRAARGDAIGADLRAGPTRTFQWQDRENHRGHAARRRR